MDFIDYIDVKYQYIIDIVKNYTEVTIDEIIEDDTEIEIDLYPKDVNYDVKNHHQYIAQCEKIRQDIKELTNKQVAYDFDKENSWQFLYIIK